MAYHWGHCAICREDKRVGYVACLRLELCIDCFWDWQNGEIRIGEVYNISMN